MEAADVIKFCKELPKVELHAHLNGSVSDKTISKHASKKLLSKYSMNEKETTLTDCFKKFDLVHNLTNSIEVINDVTKDVIDEFYNDNVKYLELRSTPKDFTEKRTTKHDYILAILNALEEYAYKNDKIEVRFIVSINRCHSINEAIETIKLTKQFKTTTDTVVGIDLSGDPRKGNPFEFVNVLQDAKNNGLKLTLHIAEVTGRNEENEKLLNLFPDRIGHGTYLFQHPPSYKFVQEHNIPLEVAITSNIKCGTVQTISDHHILDWYQLNHPLIVCTDDKGVFDTSLTNEYAKASEICNLNYNGLYKLSYSSINHTFAKNDTKEKLKKHWRNFEKSYFNKE